jgi:hypothetical protein
MHQYLEHRTGIESGDILAWSHRGWKTVHDVKIQAVRLATESEYSHVGVAWRVGGRLLVLEAVEPCARIYPLSKLGSFYHIPMGAAWTPDVEEGALSFVGAEYKQLDAIRAFFRPLPPGTVSECAALVREVALLYGVDLGDRSTPDAVVLAAQKLGRPTFYVESP